MTMPAIKAEASAAAIPVLAAAVLFGLAARFGGGAALTFVVFVVFPFSIVWTMLRFVDDPEVHTEEDQ